MSRNVKNTPYGAITSINYLKELITRAATGEKVVVYHGYGLGSGSFVFEHQIPSTATLVENQDPRCGLFLLETADQDSHTIFALGDVNIPEHGSNDNFIFIEKEFAEDYVTFVKSNKMLCEREKARMQLLQKMFRDIDERYDDRD